MNLADLVREENASIEAFVARVAPTYLTGTVLDYGCGAQPYRALVMRAGGEYVAYDRTQFGANMSKIDVGPPLPLTGHWDAILATQVVQFVSDVAGLLGKMRLALLPAGALVLTYPTNWPEVNEEDRHRFTYSGMERMLVEAGFDVVEHQLRAGIGFADFNLSYGGGIVGITR